MQVIMYLIIGVILVWFIGGKLLAATQDEDVIDMATEGLPGAIMASIFLIIAVAFWPVVVTIMCIGLFINDFSRKRKAREKANDI